MIDKLIDLEELRAMYIQLDKNVEAVLKADFQLTKEESDVFISVLSRTFNLKALWQGIRLQPL